MTKNWHSPTIPAVPNPTPTTSLVSRHASLRAPIYNPYDKFTQPQFDAWIGDITGALKRALGREEELERSPQEGERVADALMRAHHAVEADSSYLEPLSRPDNGNEDSGNDEDPSIMEDSFAHVKSRRAKGKARDPRDGPGLGGKDQPIELLSDSESDQSASVDLEEEWQEDSEEEESEEDYDEDEYEDSDEGTDQYAPGGSGSHAIELISDDDEAEDADSGGPHLDEQDDDDVDQGEDEEGGVQHEIIELDEDDDVQSSDYDQRDRSHSHQRDLLEPAQTLLGLASGPDERDLEDYNEDDGILELPDPWEGPRTYAEDFYSGSVGTNGPDELDHGPQDDGQDSLYPDFIQTTPHGDSAFAMQPSQPLDDCLESTAVTDLDPDMTVVLDAVTGTNTSGEEEEEDVEPQDDWGGIPLGTSDLDVKVGWDKDIYGYESEQDDNSLEEFVQNGGPVVSSTMDYIDVDELYASPPPVRAFPGPEYSHGSVIDLPDNHEGFGLLPPSDPPSPQADDRGQLNNQNTPIDELLAELDKRELGQVSGDVEFILQGIFADMSQSASDFTLNGSDPATIASVVNPVEQMPAQVVPPFDDTSIFDPSAGVFQNTEAKSDPATVEHPFSDAPHVYTALDTVVGKPLRLPADEHKDDEHSLPAECSNIPHVDGPPGPADAEHPVFTPNDTPYRVEEVNDATDGSRPDRDDDIDEATSVDVGEVEIQPVESYAVEEAETGECLFQEPEGNDNVSSMTTDLPNAPPAIVSDVFELAVDDVDLTFMEPTIASEGQRGYNDVVSPELEQHSTCVTTALADDTAEHILSDNAPTLKEFDEAKSLDEPLVADTTITNALYNEPSLFVDGNNSTTAEPQSNPQDEAAASPEFIPSSTCEQTQLSDIVPAPVSADPSVPDPASVGQSPQTPDISLPTSPSSTRAYAGPHFAIPASVVKALDLGLSGHSNGLFTPVNGLVDGTPAPSEGGSEPIAGTTTPIPIVNMPLDEGVETVSAMGEASIPDNRIGTAVAWADDQKQSPVAQDTDDLTSTAVDDEIVLSSTVSLDGHPNLAEKSDVAESQQFQLPIHDEHPYTVPPPALVDLAADGLYDDLSLSYPESGEESPQHPPSAMEGDREMDQGSDEDADGEIDPDYVPTSERETQSTEVDPFTLMGNDSTVAPGAVENDEPSSSESTSNSDTGESFILKPVQSDLQSHVPSENGRARSPQQPTDSAPAHPEAAHAFQDSIPDTSSSNPVAAAAMMEPPSVEAPLLSPIDEAADATAPPKQLKRKRPSPAGSSSRLTRSKSKGEHASESSQSGSSRRRNGRAATQMKLENGKLEGNSPEEPSDDEPSQSSASSVARRLLAPTSRTGSVASTASTDSAPATQVENRHSPDAQPPLIHTHTHAFIHHHHGRPPAPAPPPPARKASRSKTPALSRAASVDTQGSATTSTNSQRPSPVKRLPSMNSPVTRSNCRFHKISLPREEGGPRLSFIVPGCSLGDGELMNDEEIVDHGFATIEDHGRMIPDIESLEFNPYMVGVLRQLVGVDLLREQEVFYLPNPGEELPKKRRKKKKSRKSVVEKVKAFHRQSASQDVRAPGSSRVSELSRRSNTPSSSSASRSVGDSASVAGSSYKMEDSITGSDEDASDVDEPRTKRRKLSPVSHGEAPSPAPVSVGGELAQEPSNKPSQLRRSRRKALNPDAAAYKPTKDESADEDADDDIGPSSRKGKARKSTKRSRTVEDDAGDVPKPKKSRLRKSISVSVTARSVNAD